MIRVSLLSMILLVALPAASGLFRPDGISVGIAWAQEGDDDDDAGGDDDDDDGGSGGGAGGGTGGGTGGADGDDGGAGGGTGGAGAGGGATAGGGDDGAGGDDDGGDDNRRAGGGDDGGQRNDDDNRRPGASSAASDPVAVPPGARRIDTRRGAGDRARKGEISGLDLSRAELQRLVDSGFAVIESRSLGVLAEGLAVRLRPPPRMRDARALELARELVPNAVFDLSHLYGASRGEGVYGPEMVRFAPQKACGSGVRIGMVDGAVASHPMLEGVRINRKSFTKDNASAAHGTAVASVMVGRDPEGRALLRNSTLFAAAVFSREGGETAADAIDVAAALDWLSGQRVGVVNLSIAGPENALLEETVSRAAARGMIMVAAAGNGGAGGKPRYPAAYPEVIAVSAVDQRGRPYRNNSRGAHIDIAAPGVDIWAADARSGSGALWSGTSFAAPFVSVELAVARKSGAVGSAAGARSYLARHARDLGSAGADSIYGAGLIQSAACR